MFTINTDNTLLGEIKCSCGSNEIEIIYHKTGVCIMCKSCNNQTTLHNKEYAFEYYRQENNTKINYHCGCMEDIYN